MINTDRLKLYKDPPFPPEKKKNVIAPQVKGKNGQPREVKPKNGGEEKQTKKRPEVRI